MLGLRLVLGIPDSTPGCAALVIVWVFSKSMRSLQGIAVATLVMQLRHCVPHLSVVACSPFAQVGIVFLPSLALVQHLCRVAVRNRPQHIFCNLLLCYPHRTFLPSCVVVASPHVLQLEYNKVDEGGGSGSLRTMLVFLPMH